MALRGNHRDDHPCSCRTSRGDRGGAAFARLRAANVDLEGNLERSERVASELQQRIVDLEDELEESNSKISELQFQLDALSPRFNEGSDIVLASRGHVFR